MWGLKSEQQLPVGLLQGGLLAALWHMMAPGPRGGSRAAAAETAAAAAAGRAAQAVLSAVGHLLNVNIMVRSAV